MRIGTKKLIALLMTLVMLLSLMPASVFAEGESNEESVVEIVETPVEIVEEPKPEPQEEPVEETKPEPQEEPVEETKPEPQEEPVEETKPEPQEELVEETKPEPQEELVEELKEETPVENVEKTKEETHEAKETALKQSETDKELQEGNTKESEPVEEITELETEIEEKFENEATVEKGVLKVDYFTFNQPENCVYDGTPKVAKVEANANADKIGTINVKYSSDNGTNWSEGAPTNAGTYKVAIDVAESEYYQAASKLTYENWTFTIAKATPTADDFNVTLPENLTYDEQPKEAKVEFDNKNDTLTGMGTITVWYQYGKGSEDWKTDVPTAAGDYKVYITVAEGVNYAAVTNRLTDDDWSFSITSHEAKIGETSYPTLAGAVEKAKAGDVIEIIKDGTYTLPNISNNITIKAANGVDVKFNCVGSGSIASVPNGATFENVTMNFGQNSYHGFQHAGTINMNNCVLNGLFFSYGDMNFNGCTFNQTNKEYCMWCYAGDLSFDNCTFNTCGKVLNVYNENNGPHKLVVKDCTFKNENSSVYKPAVLIKSKCGSNELEYDVTISGNNTLVGNWPSETNVYDDGNMKTNGLWDVEADGSKITVTVGSEKVYPVSENPEPVKNDVVKLQVKENTEKGITEEVVNQVSNNSAVENFTETNLSNVYTGEGSGNFTVQFTLQEAVAPTEEDAAKLTYNVVPTLNDEAISNDQINGTVTFRLPLTAAFNDVKVVKVIHHAASGDKEAYYNVQGETGAKYVEISTPSFSVFDVLGTTLTEIPVEPEKIYFAQIGETKYETLAEAVTASKDGDTIQIIADCNETIELSNQTIIKVEDNVTYSGTVSLAEGAGRKRLFTKENLSTTEVSGMYTALCGFVPDYIVAKYPDADVNVIPCDKQYVIFAEKCMDTAYSFNAFNVDNGDMAIFKKLLGEPKLDYLSGRIDLSIIQENFGKLDDNEKARVNAVLPWMLPYMTWIADFEVTFDKDVKVGSMGVGGYYESYKIGMDIPLNRNMSVSEVYRMLNDYASLEIPYAGICLAVRTFNCGAYKLTDDINGTTMTVSLHLYNNGDDIVIGTYSYTFPEAVAQITVGETTTQYATLAEAIEAVPASQETATTISMINDTKENVTVPANKKIVLDLNGKSIDGNAANSVITVAANGELTVKDSTATNDDGTDGTGKITNGKSTNGGGITNNGKLTLLSGHIVKNENTTSSGTYGGGGVYNGLSATFVMNGGSISENSATKEGGGIQVSGGSSFTMTAGIIEKNTCTGTTGGGGIYAGGGATVKIEGGTIQNNTSLGNGAKGGGICSYGANIEMIGGTIQNNKAYSQGGGIGTASDTIATLKINGGTIINNESTNNYGGDIGVTGGTVATISGGVIGGNNSKCYNSYGTAIFRHNADKGSITITGSVEVHGNVVIDYPSTATALAQISGGKFSEKILNDEDRKTGFITGGIFTNDAKEATNANLIAIGKGFVANTDDETKDIYPWMIADLPPVAQITVGETTTKYATLAEAVVAAQTGNTIELLANVEINEAFNISGKDNIIIDLKNYSLDLVDLGGLHIFQSSVVIKNGKFTGTGRGQKMNDNNWETKIEVDLGGSLEFNNIDAGFTNVTSPDTIKNDTINGGILKIVKSKFTFDGIHKAIYVHGSTEIDSSEIIFKNGETVFDGNNDGYLHITNSTVTATEGIGNKLFLNVNNIVVTDSTLTIATNEMAMNSTGNCSIELAKGTTGSGSTLNITHAGSHALTNYQLIVNEGCTVNVEDVLYLGLNVKGNSVFKAGSTVNVSNCGKVGTGHYANVAISVVDAGNSLTIEKGANVTVDGIVSSGWLTDGTPSTINIAGGKYTKVFQREGTDTCISLTGGIYKEKPDDAYVAEGYLCVENPDDETKADYPHAVRQIIAKIGDTNYFSLQEALDEAAEIDSTTTVVLMADTTENVNCEFNNQNILDLNGKVLTGNMTAKIDTKEGTPIYAFTIVDNAETKGKIVGDVNVSGFGTFNMPNSASGTTQPATIEGSVTVDGAVEFDCKANITGGITTCDSYTGTVKIANTAKVTGTVTANAGTVKVLSNSSTSKAEVGTIDRVGEATVEITGGVFTNDPSELLGDEYCAVLNEDNKYDVVKAVAKIVRENEDGSTTDIKYATLADAIAAVENGETITILCDIPDAVGMSINNGKTFTIDFSGKTYTVGKPGAGSTGTTTQGFQIKQGSNVTFKNGTIKVDPANKDVVWKVSDTEKGIAWLINNYGNMTLSGMTINGQNLAHNYASAGGQEAAGTPRYVINNNTGNVIVNGGSHITAEQGDVAISSNWYGSAYPNHPVVDITSASIIGKVEAIAGTINLGDGENTDTSVSGQVRVGENKSGSMTGAVVNINKDVIVSNSEYPVVVFGQNTLNVYGEVKSTSTSSTDTAAIATNGNAYNAGSVINIYSGATVSAAKCNGIYMPNGQLNIFGGTISGDTAVYFKSKGLKITGGTFIGNGAKVEYNYNGNGGNSTGDALVIDSCNYPSGLKSEDVRVSGGLFSSKNNNAIAVYTSQGATPVTKFVSGGYFTQRVNGNYVAPGYECVNTPSSDSHFGSYSYMVTSKIVIPIDDEGGSIQVQVDEKAKQEDATVSEKITEETAKAAAEEIIGKINGSGGGQNKSKVVDLTETVGNYVNSLDMDKVMDLAKEMDTKHQTTKETELENLLNAAKEKASITGNNVEVTMTVTSDVAVKVTEVTVDESDSTKITTFALDITPYYTLEVVSKVTSGVGEPETKTVSIVTTEMEEKLAVPETTKVTFPAPGGFVYTEGMGLFVNHYKDNGAKKYTYPATFDTKTSMVSFTNPHGFSEFELVTIAEEYVAKNIVTEEEFDSLSEALKQAVEGQTVILLKDLTGELSQGTVEVKPNVTLDLNGFDLEARIVMAFGLVQNSQGFENGKLIIDKDCFINMGGKKKDASYNYVMPVWDNNGYVFGEVTYIWEQWTINSAGNPKYRFAPESISPSDIQTILAEDSEIKVYVEFNYVQTDAQGQTHQNHLTVEFGRTYLDQFLTDPTSRCMYVTLLGTEKVSSITAQSYLKAESCNFSIASKPITNN